MIHSFEYVSKKVGEVGEVIRSDRSVAWVTDLAHAVIGEGVSFENGEHGVVVQLKEDYVEIMHFGGSPIPIGEKVARTGEMLKITVGDGMLGDSFDALGHISSQGREPSKESENRAVEVRAVNIDGRAEIEDFCETGVMLVDLVTPLSKGQRELLIGDQKTGKTHFALSVVKAQAKKGVMCVLALVGKERREIQAIEQMLDEAGIRKSCVIIAEHAASSAARITMVPFTAMTVAEYFRDQGKDVVVVLDDLTYHAIRYREMALLSDKYPGRDTYPSDIFYLHARLLERAGSFLVKGKTVTITALPIVTTVEGDISGYIETNIMSMTDGHLFFDKNLFFDGVKPAVNMFLSVTRVGRQTQTKLQREVGQKILSVMTNYGEIKRFLRFGTELTDRVKENIRLAHGLKEALRQDGSVAIDVNVGIYLLARLWTGSWDGKNSPTMAEEIMSDQSQFKEIRGMVMGAKNFDDLVLAVRKI